MRLNLILDESDFRSGYKNVSPIPIRGLGVVPGCFDCLNVYTEDAEADEIVALDVVDFIVPSEVDATVAHWVRKLRHGGTLTIGGLDLLEAARRLTSGRIDHDAANLLIYGPQDVPARCRKASMTLRVACDVLTSYGLRVEFKSYHECYYIVTARRP